MKLRSALDERYVLSAHLYKMLSGTGQRPSPWACVDREIVGIDTTREDHSFLTESALRQLAFALTLAERNIADDIRKLVKIFLSTDLTTRKAMSLSAGKAVVDMAITESILKGQSALDLGCGISPAFARTARAMGAEVYTADVIGSDRFELLIPTLASEDRRCHVVCDLNDKKAIELILAAHSDQKFDLVTTALAQPEYGWNWLPNELAIVPSAADLRRRYPNGRIPFVCKNASIIAEKLLRPAGFFYDASRPYYFQNSRG